MEEVSDKVLIDGFVAIARDWTFLGKGVILSLPNTVKIETWRSDLFKGVSSLQHKSVARVHISEINGAAIGMIVALPESRCQLDFGKIRESFVSAVDYAISQLHGTITNRHWLGRCCVEYDKWINNRNCRSCTTPSLIVYPSDIAQFGDIFQAQFAEGLAAMRYEVFLCALRFGQNAPVSDSCRQLNNFEMDCADEIVIHLARDFTKEGQCLLWNRSKVQRLFNEPSNEYYVCFTGGNGNFEYDLSNVSEEVMDDGDPIAKHIKFYSTTFKDIHRGNPPPFKGSHVVSVLANKRKRVYNKNTLLGWLDAIERSIEWLCVEGKVEARMEVIIGIRPPEMDSLHRAYDFFNNLFGREKQDMLSEFPFTAFSRQLQIMSILIHTLREIIKNYKDDTEGDICVVPGLDTMHLAAACEMLICYGVYGKVGFRVDKDAYYNTDLRRELRLNKRTFDYADWKFNGLEFTGCVNVIANRVVYTGPYLLTDSVYENLNAEVGLEAVKELNAALSELRTGNRPEEYSNSIKIVLVTLWQAVSSYAISSVFPEANNIQQFTIEHLRSKLSGTNFEAKSSKCFVNWVFSNVSPPQKSVLQILNALRGILSVEKLMDFKRLFAQHLEKELFATCTTLLYPIEDGVFILVLPLFGIENFTYSRLSDDYKKELKTVYQLVFGKLYGDTPYMPDPTPIFIEVEDAGWNGLATVLKVLRKMWTIWGKAIFGASLDGTLATRVNLMPLTPAKQQVLLRMLAA